MSTVLEIEQAVDQLPEDDFQAFAAWFDEVRAQRADGYFERGPPGGRSGRDPARCRAGGPWRAHSGL